MYAYRFPSRRIIARVCLAGALAVAALALHAALGTPSANALPPCYPNCYPEPVLLSVSKDGSGSGTVTGTGINCGADCFEAYQPSSLSLVLTATPGAGSNFAGWTGCYSVAGNKCTVKKNTDYDVTATFQTSTVNVANSPAGAGTITGWGINCGATCTANYNPGSWVGLNASPAGGYRFDHWSGDCSGTSPSCGLSTSGVKNVTANYVRQYVLTIGASPATGGSVTALGTTCSTACGIPVDAGTTATIDAAPAAGYVFTSWSACPAPSGTTCTVTLGADTTVTANFAPLYTLTVNVSGGPNGTVSGPGWTCSFYCTQTVVGGTKVTLKGSMAAHVTFGGWSGGCTPGKLMTCSFVATGNTYVSALFIPETHTIAATTTGDGTITGPSWTCASCTTSYTYGTPVALVANPGPTAVFSSWSGCDSVSGSSCNVTMTADKTVTAAFVPKTFVLAVNPAPFNGTVSGPGITCGSGGSDCSETFNIGTAATLTASPASGYKFTGWTGACSGTGPCNVTMNADTTVGATFALELYTLDVSLPAGGGVITVTTASGSNYCTSACSYQYVLGTSVTLAPTVSSGYAFTGWSGDCSGSGSCSLVMNANKSAIATFTALP